MEVAWIGILVRTVVTGVSRLIGERSLDSFFRSPVLRLLNDDASILEKAIEERVSFGFKTGIEDEPREETATLLCGPLIEDVPFSEMIAGGRECVGVPKMPELWTLVETADLNAVALVGHSLASTVTVVIINWVE